VISVADHELAALWLEDLKENKMYWILFMILVFAVIIAFINWGIKE